jgi:hypothetical protein
MKCGGRAKEWKGGGLDEIWKKGKVIEGGGGGESLPFWLVLPKVVAASRPTAHS